DVRRSLQPAEVTSESAAPASQPSLGPASDQPVETKFLTESLARVYLTVDREYDELLERVRSALSHKMPGAAVLDLIKEGFRRIIRDDEKRKGIVDKPRADRVADDGTITQSVKRIVENRDQGKCQWPSEDGGICGSTYRVQFHHIQDRGKGGLGTPDNVIQLCQKHNFLAAEISWGEEHMAKFRKQPSAPEDLQSQLDFIGSQ
ncbi:MAG TPA: HNH endonuclease signature motif containing protein, partial [Candidatus Cybelea sp.]|nr:HNH endonuclease signature motif containing protein [Candidatus Cybelea sp.]